MKKLINQGYSRALDLKHQLQAPFVLAADLRWYIFCCAEQSVLFYMQACTLSICSPFCATYFEIKNYSIAAASTSSWKRQFKYSSTNFISLFLCALMFSYYILKISPINILVDRECMVGEKTESHYKFDPLGKRLGHLILARSVVGEGRESMKTCDSSVHWEYLHFKKAKLLAGYCF